MKKCPKCSGLMRLHYRNGGRYWDCERIINCGNLIPLDDKEELTVQEIAEDLARAGLSSSDERAREQANYRRISGGLNTVSKNKYLSEKERFALISASRVLERLATATELAKKQKKKIEKEMERRRLAREGEAHALIFTRFVPERDNLKEIAINLLVLSHLNNPRSPRVSDEVARMVKTCRQYDADVVKTIKYHDLVDSLTDNLLRDLKLELMEMVSYLGWKDEEIPELFRQVCEKYEASRDDIIQRNRLILEKLDEVIAIYKDPDRIIPLNQQKKLGQRRQ